MQPGAGRWLLLASRAGAALQRARCGPPAPCLPPCPPARPSAPQTTGVHVWFVAHPRQLREWKGQAPNLYDISGSAHFINKVGGRAV